MAYDDYSSDLKKTENLINCVKRFIIELELNEGLHSLVVQEMN